MTILRKRRQVTGDRGVAILVVLMIIALLVAVLFSVNRRARTGMDAVMVFRDRVTLSHMAASGIHIGQAVLVEDRINTEIDSIQEAWADPVALEGIVGEFPFEKGSLSLRITDLMGRIQVNALVQFPEGRQVNGDQEVLWYRLMDLVKIFSGPDYDIRPVAILHAIKDWLDSGDDDATEDFGAESDYYQSLTPSYTCRNGPVIDVSELALVKGMSAGIFNVIDASYGISDMVTTFGMVEVAQGEGFTFPGRININTAPVYVLAALIPEVEDAHLAAEIDAFRSEISNGLYVHDLSGAAWYKQAPGCEEINISPALITTRSDFFQIEATAVLGEMQVTQTAVVRRVQNEKTGKWECRVLKWQS
ncbi:MAG: general secretion pathway protein GspK [Thermodesulfobacteriota bacterium]|nr:general secretion pathway protein GspK [Thermodesulfobacteriota bacterium]